MAHSSRPTALATSEFFETMAVGTGSAQSAVLVYENGSLEPKTSFRAFRGQAGRGVSLAVGDLNADASADVAVGSRGHGPATVRLFDTSGNLVREFKNILPGIFPHGVNVAIGDVNGDNFDDLVVSAGKGREPLVTALDGQDIANGVANPKTLFTFVAGGGARAGAKVAVGYVAPATVPSYLADVVTTPEAGREAGTVQVWNPADLGVDVSHSAMDMMTDMGTTMTDGSTPPAAPTASHDAPMPMASFRPFGRTRGAVADPGELPERARPAGRAGRRKLAVPSRGCLFHDLARQSGHNPGPKAVSSNGSRMASKTRGSRPDNVSMVLARLSPATLGQGVGFVSLTEQLDLMTSTDRAMTGMLADFAEFEREVLRKRVHGGIAGPERSMVPPPPA